MLSSKYVRGDTLHEFKRKQITWRVGPLSKSSNLTALLIYNSFLSLMLRNTLAGLSLWSRSKRWVIENHIPYSYMLIAQETFRVSKCARESEDSVRESVHSVYHVRNRDPACSDLWTLTFTH